MKNKNILYSVLFILFVQLLLAVYALLPIISFFERNSGEPIHINEFESALSHLYPIGIFQGILFIVVVILSFLLFSKGGSGWCLLLPVLSIFFCGTSLGQLSGLLLLLYLIAIVAFNPLLKSIRGKSVRLQEADSFKENA